MPRRLVTANRLSVPLSDASTRAITCRSVFQVSAALANSPKRSFWRDAQLDTIRFALIKVVGRVAELASRIELALPSDYPYRDSLTFLAIRAAQPP